MLKLKILTIFLFFSVSAFCQQEPMYSQYIFNGLLINPAYAGSSELLNATLLYRTQWIGIPGSPKTSIFSIDSPIKNQKIGLGLKIISDKIGVTTHSSISGVYSYKLYFTKSVLSFGLEGGVGFYNSNLTDVKYSQNSQIDPSFQQNYNGILPEFNVGIYYYTKHFYSGFSVTDILAKSIQNINPNLNSDMGIHVVSHFFLTSGYLIDLTPNIMIQPSLLIKCVPGAPIEGDFNAIIMMYDKISFGVSYRSYASIDVLTEVRITNRLKIGYSYEYSTNELSAYNSGSHEIVLRYKFDNRIKFISPRYF